MVGRPPIPKDLRGLIVTMAKENPGWGEGRIADELSLKRGIFVDVRTAGKYMSGAVGPGNQLGAMEYVHSTPCQGYRRVRLLHFDETFQVL